MLEIYRSSRIEKLADLLAEHLRQQTPASVLAPQTVVVGHLGMKRWLLQRLAEWQPERGRRIAANLDMLLPSEWLDGLALQVLGRQSIAIAPYRRQALRWRIHALLPRIDSPELAHYLEGEDAPRRHFQLADRLAGLFGQYLVYRRDWLAAWERGETAGVPHWQNQLWRRLVAEIGLDHRGRRMSELAARLPALAPDADQPALHVFGVSHLPPDALAALDALSRSRRVAVYFPDPCRELWEHLRSRRAVYAASLRGEAFLEIGHPLLGALGRIGQHFTLLLNGLDAGCDLRHQDDERAQGLLPAGSTLLQRVQHSIRTLQPEWVRRAPGDHTDPRTDASLRVHACHTRLRELEVLKDALLDQLAADPALNPRDIVVMAPNMALYAPLLPVVFGAPARRDSVLPWRLADVALARTHPLLGAVRELLDLPTQRITRSQVLALLALPAVARRFDLDAGGHAALTRWLERAHVAWGLDGEMKRDFGAAPVDEHSFAFGCDRMFAGYLLGEVPADTLLDESILPARPVSGPDAASLGALWGLLDVLREWRAAMRRRRSLGEWSTLLREWLERLFAVDPRDDGEREALAAVLALAADLATQQVDAGVLPEVEWSVVREVLHQGLEGIPERQPFLAGGITFCGMVPQRSIPFEVIALLGLNDGEYPRARPDSGLDLMQSHPRLGDRDNRADDRYLFLEALMSARRTLHLSHVGEGAQDGKPRNPALPLEELLGFLDQHAAVAGHERPWRVRHALQPFDARYFGGEPEDPRWFSYSEEFSRVVAAGQASEWRFLDGTGLQGAPAATGTVELRALAAYFRDPAGWVCRQALKLSRAALEESAPSDDEPLAVSRDRRDRMHIDLCWQALRQGQTRLPLQPPAEFSRSGRYASGKLGEHAWQQTRAQAQAWLDLACSLPPFDGAAPTALAQAIDLELGGVRLIGSVGQVYQRGSSLWLVSISPVASDFRQLLPVFLDWAALRLALPQADLHLRVIHRGKDDMPELGPAPNFATDPDPLRRGLVRLIALYQDAFRTAAAYHARSSHALAANLAAGDADKALEASRRAWRGQHESVGERDYAPGYNRMIAGDDRFLHPGRAEHARFDQLARELYDLLRGALPEHAP
ncbi:MAG: exodeoxyribonuclease V subunit gamma [Rhodanobacteraceae bacterium]|nr:exodeoxyribonuclease V subunit gamma [Rhodanobacteraceae bacterium]